MKCIAYRSRLREDLDAEATLAAIEQVAKRENRGREITGVLIYRDRDILQVIEGPDDQIYQLLANIRHDERHSNIEILCESRISSRSLPDWNMEVANLDFFDRFTDDQLQKAVELTRQSIGMDTDTFLFVINELLAEPEFQALLD